MNGTGTSFRPKATFTREQAIVTVRQAHKSLKLIKLITLNLIIAI